MAWKPSSLAERDYYDVLFNLANSGNNSEEVTGQQAVQFLGHTNVPTSHLREIWSLSCHPTRASLTRADFYIAMRYVGMAQNGIALSAENLASTNARALPNAQVNMPGAPPPPPSGGPATPATEPAMAADSSGLPYAMTTSQLEKYVDLFKKYDTDGDGFLSGGEAVGILTQSGLDKTQLRGVWAMADQDGDGQLSEREFAVAFHLILCVTKRKMPMPKMLPAELQVQQLGREILVQYD